MTPIPVILWESGACRSTIARAWCRPSVRDITAPNTTTCGLTRGNLKFARRLLEPVSMSTRVTIKAGHPPLIGWRSEDFALNYLLGGWQTQEFRGRRLPSTTQSASLVGKLNSLAASGARCRVNSRYDQHATNPCRSMGRARMSLSIAGAGRPRRSGQTGPLHYMWPHTRGNLGVSPAAPQVQC